MLTLTGLIRNFASRDPTTIFLKDPKICELCLKTIILNVSTRSFSRSYGDQNELGHYYMLGGFLIQNYPVDLQKDENIFVNTLKPLLQSLMATVNSNGYKMGVKVSKNTPNHLYLNLICYVIGISLHKSTLKTLEILHEFGVL